MKRSCTWSWWHSQSWRLMMICSLHKRVMIGKFDSSQIYIHMPVTSLEARVKKVDYWMPIWTPDLFTKEGICQLPKLHIMWRGAATPTPVTLPWYGHLLLPSSIPLLLPHLIQACFAPYHPFHPRLLRRFSALAFGLDISVTCWLQSKTSNLDHHLSLSCFRHAQVQHLPPFLMGPLPWFVRAQFSNQLVRQLPLHAWWMVHLLRVAPLHAYEQEHRQPNWTQRRQSLLRHHWMASSAPHKWKPGDEAGSSS